MVETAERMPNGPSGEELPRGRLTYRAWVLSETGRTIEVCVKDASAPNRRHVESLGEGALEGRRPGRGRDDVMAAAEAVIGAASRGGLS